MKLYLKIASVILIIMAVLMIVVSAFSLTGGTVLGSMGVSPELNTPEGQGAQALAVTVGALAIVMGVVMLLVGIFDLITGIFGLRGAKDNPRVAGRAKVMGAIALVIVLAENVYTVAVNPSFRTIAFAVVGLAFQFFFVWAAYKVQHEDDALKDA